MIHIVLIMKTLFISKTNILLIIALSFSLKKSTDEGFLKKQEEIMSNIFIYLVYIECFVDSSNYSIPINYYRFAQTQGVSKGLLQSRYMNI